jgi:hypothetical protein
MNQYISLTRTSSLYVSISTMSFTKSSFEAEFFPERNHGLKSLRPQIESRRADFLTSSTSVKGILVGLIFLTRL